MPGTALKLGRRTVTFSNLDKVLYPQARFTKADAIEYYVQIAPVMLPHLRDRAVTLKRYPDGVEGKFFYEKRCPKHRPSWVRTATVQTDSDGERIDYCVMTDAASLAWLANLAALEIHTLLSTTRDPQRPTMMVFDLDPGPPAGVIDAVRVALRLRDLLDDLGLKSFAKTSGGKGIHVAVSLNTPVDYERTKPFSHAVARILEKQTPDQVVSNMKKSLRVGKVLVDWSQNDAHKTTACAYSLRARQRPTVSTPVTWKELESATRTGKAASLAFEAADVLRRVESKGDLFGPVLELRQRLPKL